MLEFITGAQEILAEGMTRIVLSNGGYHRQCKLDRRDIKYNETNQKTARKSRIRSNEELNDCRQWLENKKSDSETYEWL